MRRRLPPDLAPPLLVADEAALAKHSTDGRRVLRYEAGRRDLADITEQVPTLLETWRSSVRNWPLTADVTYNLANHAIHPVFGPDAKGEYPAMRSENFVISVPHELRTRTGISWTRSCITVRHATHGGFLVYFPPLPFSRTSEGTLDVHWQGSGISPAETFGIDCRWHRTETLAK